MSYQTYLGDCKTILPTLGNIDALVSDPPYGSRNNCDYTRFSKGGVGRKGSQQFRQIANDDRDFDPTHLLGYPKVCLFGFNHFSSSLPKGTLLIWCKRTPNKLGKFLSDCEVAWCSRGKGNYLFHHVWDGFLRDSEKGQKAKHPTQKPVAVMRWVLDKLAVPVGATVVDPYMGSGTTGVACLETGRNFIGIELDPEYFAIANERLASVHPLAL